jgi:hypothetical protein
VRSEKSARIDYQHESAFLESSFRCDTFVSVIQERTQQIEIRSRPFEVLRVVKA